MRGIQFLQIGEIRRWTMRRDTGPHCFSAASIRSFGHVRRCSSTVDGTLVYFNSCAA